MDILKEVLPLFKVGSEVDSLFANLLDEMNVYNPSTNVLEQLKDGSYKLHIDIPGVDKQDMEMSIDADSILIKAKRHGFKAFLFEKRYALPLGTDLHIIKAKYENGVLVVTLPQAEARAHKVSIDID